MANPKLRNLRKAKRNLKEASGAVGSGRSVGDSGATKGGGPEANKGFDNGEEVGLVSQDDRSRPVPQHPSDMGVHQPGTPKAYDVKQTEMGGAGKTGIGGSVKPVQREAGASAGRSEVGDGGENIGSDEAVEMANPVPRESGAKAGAAEVGEYHDMDAFRSRVREAFGMSPESPRNKGNDGISGSVPGGNVDQNA